MMLRHLPLLLLFFLCTSASAQLNAQLNPDHWQALAPRNIGPAGMSGRVTAIDVHPRDRDNIYVGTASGGLWQSKNGGTSFTPIFDDNRYLSIGAVSVSDANPSIIWAGTGEGNPRNSANYGGGIYKSLDGGATWKHMGLEKTRHIHRVLPHPTDPDVAYVGAMGNMWAPNEERGVYKTTDGGVTWDRVLYVNEGTGIAEMVMDPSNPDKLIAATWTFDRDPDYFNSGGTGSGIWVSHDGGDNWERRTAKSGLPKGDLGRIGLAIAASSPNIVYALVEAKVNGLYKSTDGGATFKLVSTEDIGNRPFYYAELYVDPKNENRIYNVFTYVSKSEDGGKSFRQIADYGNGVHPDHHALWIDPNDPEYVIDGNDGGLNFSSDGGETWRFAANLPLAQFYHINYDMSFPYLVGGGMQDNGSWVGPSQGLHSGGITDADWQEVNFGDGFDLVFKPGDANTVYAASQGGYVNRINRRTGSNKSIRPIHPDGTFLRFNWNAPIAQGDQDPCSFYMGSQFVHKSTDCGDNWEIISPDLTTNDTTLQRSMRSGGLTIDATQAENHTTLLVIEPNHKSGSSRQALWTGSDDGRLHLSKDDGATWEELTSRLPGFTARSWIPYIEASEHDEAEAFVVVNDYRRGDVAPYVYHTDNFGQSFTRLVDEDDVTGHVLCIVQDPVEPNLLFLGTDQGLWISYNKGQDWTHHTAGFPAVQVADLKIHPREYDLIIGTFGRAAWILDDIRPFREIAKSNNTMLRDSFAVFPAPDAYDWSRRSYQGTRFYAQGQYQGEDRPGGAMLTYWVLPQKDSTELAQELARPLVQGNLEKGKVRKAKTPSVATTDTTDNTARMLRYTARPQGISEDMPGRENARFGLRENPDASTDGSGNPNPIDGPKQKVKVQVVDPQSGDTIRTYKITPTWGMNRTGWNLRADGVPYPSRTERKKDADLPSGNVVAPGVYEVVMTYGEQTGKTMLTVKADPREPATDQTDLRGKAMRTELDSTVVRLDRAWTQLQDAGKSLKTVETLLKDAPADLGDGTSKDSLTADIKTLRKQIADLEEVYTEPEDQKGIQRVPTNVQAMLYTARSYVSDVDGAPSQMATLALAQAQSASRDFIRRVEVFMSGEFAGFRGVVEGVGFSLFR
ncbi:VPS10 domain-containing protein [Neolewinella antarctica]|uniref:Photosystem II stability/assembly factor-like uncharacterized protein n=1 Tax=Neolewinella antarctica TaxID=442734 RepID=A0ABX0XEK6_9BACT|nr:hypothetical protein [Neolewinella antarctica]NJC27637.1 photosystem II stability/assembly factor-like uncharacterized protein [Neolewinella antarctica]